MKRFLSLIVGLILSFSSFAQVSNPIEYPKYDTDSNGQQVLVMTIQQAQALDNSTDLLALLEKLNTQMSDYDSICVKVINDKEVVIASQKIEISKLKQSLDNKDEQIKSLQGEVASYLKKILILEDQLANRQKVIDEKNIQLRKAKTKMIFGGIGGSVIISVLVGLLIVN